MLGSVAAKVYYGLLTLDGGQGGATYVRTIARLGLGSKIIQKQRGGVFLGITLFFLRKMKMKQSKNAKLDNGTRHTTLFNFSDPPFLVLCAVCRWPAPVLHYAEIIQQQWGGVFVGSTAVLVQRRHIPPDPPTNDNRKQTKLGFELKIKNVFVRRRPRAKIKRFELPGTGFSIC